MQNAAACPRVPSQRNQTIPRNASTPNQQWGKPMQLTKQDGQRGTVEQTDQKAVVSKNTGPSSKANAQSQRHVTQSNSNDCGNGSKIGNTKPIVAEEKLSSPVQDDSSKNDPATDPNVPLPPLLIVNPKYSAYIFFPDYFKSLLTSSPNGTFSSLPPGPIPQEQRPYIVLYLTMPLLTSPADLKVQFTRSGPGEESIPSFTQVLTHGFLGKPTPSMLATLEEFNSQNGVEMLSQEQNNVNCSVEVGSEVFPFEGDPQYREFRRYSKQGAKPIVDDVIQPNDAKAILRRSQLDDSTQFYELLAKKFITVSLPPRGDPTINNNDRSIIYRGKYSLQLNLNTVLGECFTNTKMTQIDPKFLQSLIPDGTIQAQYYQSNGHILSLKCGLNVIGLNNGDSNKTVVFNTEQPSQQPPPPLAAAQTTPPAPTVENPVIPTTDVPAPASKNAQKVKPTTPPPQPTTAVVAEPTLSTPNEQSTTTPKQQQQLKKERPQRQERQSNRKNAPINDQNGEKVQEPVEANTVLDNKTQKSPTVVAPKGQKGEKGQKGQKVLKTPVVAASPVEPVPPPQPPQPPINQWSTAKLTPEQIAAPRIIPVKPPVKTEDQIDHGKNTKKGKKGQQQPRDQILVDNCNDTTKQQRGNKRNSNNNKQQSDSIENDEQGGNDDGQANNKKIPRNNGRGNRNNNNNDNSKNNNKDKEEINHDDPELTKLDLGYSIVECPDGDEPLLFPLPPADQTSDDNTMIDDNNSNIDSDNVNTPTDVDWSGIELSPAESVEVPKKVWTINSDTVDELLVTLTPEDIVNMTGKERRKLIKDYRRSQQRRGIKEQKVFSEHFPMIKDFAEDVATILTEEELLEIEEKAKNAPLGPKMGTQLKREDGEQYSIDEYGNVHQDPKKKAHFEQLKDEFEDLLGPKLVNINTLATISTPLVVNPFYPVPTMETLEVAAEESTKIDTESPSEPVSDNSNNNNNIKNIDDDEFIEDEKTRRELYEQTIANTFQNIGLASSLLPEKIIILPPNIDSSRKNQTTSTQGRKTSENGHKNAKATNNRKLSTNQSEAHIEPHPSKYHLSNVVSNVIEPIYKACASCRFEHKLTCNHCPLTDSFNLVTFNLDAARQYRKNHTLPLQWVIENAVNLHQLDLTPKFVENDLYHLYGVGHKQQSHTKQHKKSSSSFSPSASCDLVSDAAITKLSTIPTHTPRRITIQPFVQVRLINDRNTEKKVLDQGGYQAYNADNDEIHRCIDHFDPNFNQDVTVENVVNTVGSNNSNQVDPKLTLPKTLHGIVTHTKVYNKLNHIMTDADFVLISTQREAQSQVPVYAAKVIPGYSQKYENKVILVDEGKNNQNNRKLSTNQLSSDSDDDNNNSNTPQSQEPNLVLRQLLQKKPMKSNLLVHSPEPIQTATPIKIKAMQSIPSYSFTQNKDDIVVTFDFKKIQNINDTQIIFSKGRIDGTIAANGNKIPVKWILEHEILPDFSSYTVYQKKAMVVITLASAKKAVWTQPFHLD